MLFISDIHYGGTTADWERGQEIMLAVSRCDFEDGAQVKALVGKYPHLVDCLPDKTLELIGE